MTNNNTSTTAKAFLKDLEALLIKHTNSTGTWELDSTLPPTYTATLTLDGEPHTLSFSLDYEYWWDSVANDNTTTNTNTEGEPNHE